MNLDQAGPNGGEAGSELLTLSRKRMLDAETTYMTARQKWDNKESRQRSY